MLPVTLPPTTALLNPAPSFSFDEIFQQRNTKPKFDCKRKCPDPVNIPGPLPIFGAVTAMATSRRIRARIKDSLKWAELRASKTQQLV